MTSKPLNEIQILFNSNSIERECDAKGIRKFLVTLVIKNIFWKDSNSHMCGGLWIKLHETCEYGWDKILECFKHPLWKRI